MAGYTSSWSAINGDLIDASLFLNEYGNVEAAFDSASGHTHDGTAQNGAYIPLISEVNNYTKAVCNAANIELSVYDGVADELQLRLVDGALVPTTSNDVDLGSTTLRFKDIWSVGATTLNTLQLNAGVQVASILDEDTMASDSATALATQQSIKAYVDSFSGAIPSRIQTPDTFNSVKFDDANDAVVFAVDVTSVETDKLRVDASALFPHSNLDLDLGKTIFKFNKAYLNSIELTTGITADAILDEDDMVSDSATAIPTQQSVKAFVENNATLDGGTF